MKTKKAQSATVQEMAAALGHKQIKTTILYVAAVDEKLNSSPSKIKQNGHQKR